jgi:phosphate transport system protein
VQTTQRRNAEYDRELARLRERVLVMGARVEEMIAQAMRAFVDHDEALAESVIAADGAVDQMEIELDQLCLEILAMRQPVASDLRFVTSVLKGVTDLERIGDLATNLAERIIGLGDHEFPGLTREIERIGHAAQGMLHDALDAFVARDAVRAESIMKRDGSVDAAYAKVFPELLGQMTKDPSSIHTLHRLQSIAKYLERIADHATNLAEMVVFMVCGQDRRHSSKS